MRRAVALAITAASLAVISLAVAAPARAQYPQGYPAGYAAIVEAAKNEGKVVVSAAVDRAAAAPLIEDFEALYPGIAVTYLDFASSNLYNHVVTEAAAGAGTSDIVWSSSTDLQVKLVAEGYAATYASPESPNLPKWAVWRDEAYGTTYEPVTIVYNKRLVPAGDVPQDHPALLRLLTTKTATYSGKLAAYDPERSGAGYLLATQDVANWPQAWDLFGAFGKVGIKLYTGSADMVDRVASGEYAIAYGIFGSYALTRSKHDPALGVIMPKDYTLVVSRVMFIPKGARHPNAARLFLDYMLSRRGQTVIARKAELYALRSDVEGEATAAKVSAMIGDRVRAVPIGEALLANLEARRRADFLDRWQAAMKAR